MSPDWKPAKRERDPDVFLRLHLVGGNCASCGRRHGLNLHHVLGRAQGGDDVEENLIFLCGSGAEGCHGALHGNPYVDARGRRRTSEDVRRAAGEALLRSRPDVVAYVLAKLGRDAGEDYLERHYYVAAGE